ncbi:MAG: thioredoxin [Prolixibacteraceae bacterium]|jgi:thioredoxin 1|nr:thioredoxin [Prolixibacteraceae bacterium]
MNTVLIVVASVLAILFVVRWFAMRKIKNTPMVDDHKNILTLTDKNFKQQTKNRLVLVDFWAEWCAPCRLMAPTLNEVAAELKGDAYVGKVNIEQYQSMAQRHKVRNIPTLILFKNGIEIKRYVGVKGKDFLLNEIEKMNPPTP